MNLMLFLKLYFEIFKKIFIVFAAFFVVISFFSYSINKERTNIRTATKIEARREIYRVLENKDLAKTKEGQTLLAAYRYSLCGMVGEACTNNPGDGDTNFKRSIFGSMGSLIVAPIANPPASGFYWVRSSLQEAGFVPKTQAVQGIGFASLEPLLFIWKIFRNISFMLLVIVLIAIGFMIMFRVKINQQTVIALENSLPRIVVSMLLITFSFAIAGFLIDLMYVITSFGISVIANNEVVEEMIGPDFQYKLYSGGAGTLLSNIYFSKHIINLGPALFELFPSVITTFVRMVLIILTVWGLAHLPISKTKHFFDGRLFEDVPASGLLNFIFFSIILAVFLPLVGYIAPYILSIILIFFTGLIVFFRIFFLIFKSYLKILIYTIFSPLVMLAEAVPGKNMFSKWFRNMIAELSVFPVVILLLLISNVVVSAPIAGGQLWQPPLLGTSTQQVGPFGFKILVGIGILYMIPEIAKLVKQALGVKEEGKRVGLGTFFGGITAPAKGLLGGAQQFSNLAFTISKLPKGITKHIPQLLGGSREKSET